MLLRFVWLILFTGLIGGQACAQATASLEENTFDVVVRDKKGKPVRNLKASDLKVTDNGAAVAITKLGAMSGGDSSITLLFDHMEPSAEKGARSAADRLLKISTGSNITFAAFRVWNRLALLEPLTTDRMRLRGAINEKSANDAVEKQLRAEVQTGAKPDGTKLNSEEKQAAKAMLMALNAWQELSHDDRLVSPLAALLAVVRAEQMLPGRKAILFFTSNLRLDRQSRELVRTVIGLANRGGVSIYAINENPYDNAQSNAIIASIALGNQRMSGQTGIAAGTPIGAPSITSTMGEGATSMNIETAARVESGDGQGAQGPLADLCYSTAGRLLQGSSKFDLNQMLEDLNFYYRASYAAPAMQYDGQFRRLQIKSAVKNLRVQARTGYLALPVEAPIGARPFEAELKKVLAQPQLPAGLGFDGAVMHMGSGSNVAVVEIPFRDFVFSEDHTTKLFFARALVLAQVKDASGTVVESFSEDMARRGAESMRDRIRADVATMQRAFDAAPGEYTLEVAVQDAVGHRTGALRRKFTVAATVSGLGLSDVALVRKTEPLRADSDSLDGMQYGANRVIARVSPKLSADDRELPFYFTIQPDAASTALPELELEIRRDGQAVGRGKLAVRKADGAKPIAYMAKLQTGSFGTGKYEAAIIVTSGGKTIERVAAFEIPGVEVASAGAPVIVQTHKTLDIEAAAETAAKPADELLSSLLEAAKQQALDYTDRLPNVTCVEVTDRSVDRTGSGAFQHQDTIAEMIRYFDKSEKRAMLTVNNEPSTAERDDLKGTISHGEFGGLLNSIFNADAHAQFTWKETDLLGADSVQVFAYQVAAEHSNLGVTAANGDRVNPGFHGLVYVDESTRAVRRLILESDELRADFPTRAVKFAVDYDYIAIGEHEYLLPVTGSMRVNREKRMVVLNEFDFRDYKRYVADSKIHF